MKEELITVEGKDVIIRGLEELSSLAKDRYVSITVARVNPGDDAYYSLYTHNFGHLYYSTLEELLTAMLYMIEKLKKNKEEEE